MLFKTLTLLILMGALSDTHGAKILGVFNMPSKSHLIICDALMQGLAKRGHEITMITPFKSIKPNENITEIVVTGLKDILDGAMPSKNMFDVSKEPKWNLLFKIGETGRNLSKFTFDYPEVKQLLKSNQKFDIVIVEIFLNEAVLGFAQHFDAIPVALTTGGATSWVNGLVGNVENTAYQPNVITTFTTKMTYWQRMANTALSFFGDLIARTAVSSQRELYNEYFQALRSDPVPDFDDVLTNVSLVLLNSHHTVGYPRANVPNMIDVAGIHIQEDTTLPSDIQLYLDNAKEGVIYFSLGSNVRSADMPKEQRDAILKAFGSLKQKVLWKWEESSLEGQPHNVVIGPWMPQQSILAHPNVKCFITHGGLLSSIEAIYYGVPIIGVPIFGDQFYNMAKAVNAGYGIQLNVEDINEESLKQAINSILTDSSYQENISRLSAILRDEPQTALEKAIYHVEYMLRHKGAPFLRSPRLNVTGIQAMLLDVFAGIAAVIITIIAIACFVTRKLFCKKFKTNKKKRE